VVNSRAQEATQYAEERTGVRKKTHSAQKSTHAARLRTCRRLSGTATTPLFASMVQKG